MVYSSLSHPIPSILAQIWNEGVTLYCQFHILKNAWKNVNSRCPSSVGMDSRLELYGKFRQLMYWQPEKGTDAEDLKDLFDEKTAVGAWEGSMPVKQVLAFFSFPPSFPPLPGSSALKTPPCYAYHIVR